MSSRTYLNRTETLSQLWEEMNETFFHGMLLVKPMFHIYDSGVLSGVFLNPRKRESWGCAIFINERLFGGKLRELVDTLMHEMVHQLQWETGRRVGHDAFFRFQSQRLGIEI